MNFFIRLLRPHASVPPIPMGCLTTLFLLPVCIVFLPVTLFTLLVSGLANGRG
jgi:hypothetical protein